MTKIEKKKLTDFRPQDGNANGHTERGLKALGDAYGEVGYVTPMTAAASGEMLDGSARLERAISQFPDEALVISHDGSKPIVMVREDVKDAADPKAKRISYGANRIGEIDLAWDPEQVLADLDTGVDLGGLFSDNELAEIEEEAQLASELADSLMDGITQSNNRALGDKKKQIKPVLYVDEISVFEAAIKVRMGGSWNVGTLQSAVSKYGNDLHPIYLEVCQELLKEKASEAGYNLTRFAGYYCGHAKQMTHYLGVLEL